MKNGSADCATAPAKSRRIGKAGPFISGALGVQFLPSTKSLKAMKKYTKNCNNRFDAIHQTILVNGVGAGHSVRANGSQGGLCKPLPSASFKPQRGTARLFICPFSGGQRARNHIRVSSSQGHPPHNMVPRPNYSPAVRHTRGHGGGHGRGLTDFGPSNSRRGAASI